MREEVRLAASQRMKRLWADPVWREAMLAKIRAGIAASPYNRHNPRPRQEPRRSGCYLLCWGDTPLYHAGHYLGWSSNIQRRIREHQSGHGANLVRVVVEKGISFQVSRLWIGAPRTQEQALKSKHNSRMLCPVCCKRGRFHSYRKSGDV